MQNFSNVVHPVRYELQKCRQDCIFYSKMVTKLLASNRKTVNYNKEEVEVWLKKLQMLINQWNVAMEIAIDVDHIGLNSEFKITLGNILAFKIVFSVSVFNPKISQILLERIVPLVSEISTFVPCCVSKVR